MVQYLLLAWFVSIVEMATWRLERIVWHTYPHLNDQMVGPTDGSASSRNELLKGILEYQDRGQNWRKVEALGPTHILSQDHMDHFQRFKEHLRVLCSQCTITGNTELRVLQWTHVGMNRILWMGNNKPAHSLAVKFSVCYAWRLVTNVQV